MQKTYTLPENEYNKLHQDKEDLRKENGNLRKQITSLEQEIEYMKTGKEDVLLVVKDKEKKDEYYIKSKEKEVLKQLILINKEIVDENIAYIENINELKKTLELYNNENTILENISFDLKKKLEEKTQYVINWKKRSWWRRLFNIEPKDENI